MATFVPPVTVEPGRLGRYRVISNSREASDLLLGRWPPEHGQCYHAALRVCQAVTSRPGEARLAFIDAAREARVLISVDNDHLP
jgi:hypothetical protein